MIQDLRERLQEAQIEKVQEMYIKEQEDLQNKERDEQYDNWNERYTGEINSRINKEGEQISEAGR